MDPAAPWIEARAELFRAAGLTPDEAQRAARFAWDSLSDFQRRFYAASTPERPCCRVAGPDGAN